MVKGLQAVEVLVQVIHILTQAEAVVQVLLEGNLAQIMVSQVMVEQEQLRQLLAQV